ncbi:hypothetical protein [Microbispora sp. NPDC049125]|uniref:hypothetical protein n=1 Tax=Microbispora sp. NPDC049125 TaxID=3154929 RepID=UPI003465628C
MTLTRGSAQYAPDDLPALHSFTLGLDKDAEAVVAGLTLPHSNGPTEGTDTSAGFALLRQRVLLS